MLHPETEQKIAELFRLNVLRTGITRIVDLDGNLVGNTWVDMIWIVRLGYYRYPSIVAVMHSRDGTKGLFFVPRSPDYHVDDLGIVTNPVKTVDLPDWEDPVLRALQSVNLAVRDIDEHKRYTIGYSYWIHVMGFGGLIAELRGECPGNDPTWDRLGEAILATVKTVVGKYKNRKMRKFLKTDPYNRWWQSR